MILAFVFTFRSVDTETVNKEEATKPCLVAEYATKSNIALQSQPCAPSNDYCLIAEPCPYVGMNFLVCLYLGEPITVIGEIE